MIFQLDSDPNITDWLSAVGQMGEAVAAFIVVFYGLYQLKQIRTQLSNDSLRIILDIESQINTRKVDFDRATKALREAELAKLSDDHLSIASDFFDSMRENYFNALDRLCFCIRKDYLPERDWRTEYRNMLMETVKEFESDFGAASPFKSIIELNKKWQAE